MNELTVRLATENDLDELLRVFAAARVFMREQGNPTQWGTDRPTRGEIEKSLERRDCYVVERPAVPADGNGGGPSRVICGTFSVRFGEDPMYRVIESGAWLSDGPYVAVHALASDGTARGIYEIALRFAEDHPSRSLAGQTAEPDEPVRSLRVDTHRNNVIMQRKFLASGFTYCGIVHMVIDGTERLAYEKLL